MPAVAKRKPPPLRRDPNGRCWAYCPDCDVDVDMAVTVPCPMDVYIAALKATRCPTCGGGKQTLQAYSPGYRGRR